jgi:hypothetical protein
LLTLSSLQLTHCPTLDRVRDRKPTLLHSSHRWPTPAQSSHPTESAASTSRLSNSAAIESGASLKRVTQGGSSQAARQCSASSGPDVPSVIASVVRSGETGRAAQWIRATSGWAHYHLGIRSCSIRTCTLDSHAAPRALAATVVFSRAWLAHATRPWPILHWTWGSLRAPPPPYCTPPLITSPRAACHAWSTALVDRRTARRARLDSAELRERCHMAMRV